MKIRNFLFFCLSILLPFSLRSQDSNSTMLPALLNMNVPLTKEDREAAMREVVTRKCYHDWSLQLGAILTTDYKSGHVDQKPWIARLRLAQIFDWLGTDEVEYTSKWLAQHANFHGPAPTRDQLLEMLKNSDIHAKLAAFLGDEANLPQERILADRLKPETLVALLSQEDLMGTLGQTVNNADYQPGVWRVLGDLQEGFPDKIGDYPALAVALAVVFDKSFRYDWPHHQVSRSAVPFVWQNWKPLFDYFTQADSNGQLLTDIRNLRADQLKYMVDAPVDVKDLAWIQEKVTFSRNSFDKVFPTIEYNYNRLKNHVYNWDFATYHLSDIKTHGGICVDQAYYSVMAGKAKGLPSLFFSGQGVDGGHAWFGYLVEDNKWNMNAGRYADQNYVSGTVYDPQTWHPITDHELAFISDPGDSQVLYDYCRNITMLAELPTVASDSAKRQEILAEALKVKPELPMIWEAVEQVIKENGTADDLMKHYQGMADQFASQDDVKITALARLLPLQRKAGLNDAADQTEDAMLNCRADLAIRCAGQLMEEKIKAQQFDEAWAFYDKLLPKLNDKKNGGGGGNLYFYFVSPTVEAFQSAQQHDLAENAFHRAEKLFNADSTSIIQENMAMLRSWLEKNSQ